MPSLFARFPFGARKKRQRLARGRNLSDSSLSGKLRRKAYRQIVVAPAVRESVAVPRFEAHRQCLPELGLRKAAFRMVRHCLRPAVALCGGCGGKVFPTGNEE